MSHFSVVILTLWCAWFCASASPVSPNVDQSSKKFFGKDLPVDGRPVADKNYHFDHPYPTVQDSDDFDTDFTKDENTDGGKWQAQMDYDTIRRKVTEAEKKLADLKEKMELAVSVAKTLKKAWMGQRDARVSAESQAEQAKGKLASEDSKVKSLSTEVGRASGNVEKEMKDLYECRKKVDAAKQALKDLLAKQKELEEKAAEAAAKEAEAVQKKKEEAKKARDKKLEEAEKHMNKEQIKHAEEEKARQSEHEKNMETYEGQMKEYQKDLEKYNYDVAKQAVEYKNKVIDQRKEIAKEVSDMNADDASWKKKIAQEKAEYEKSAAAYDKISEQVQQAEAVLEKATADLKKFRREPHVDANGGVYVTGPKESSTIVASLNIVTLAAALLAAPLY